jgi:hypothetical protein
LAEMSFSARVLRFFFMYLGPLVTIVVYFAVFGAAGDSMSGVRTALFVALGMQSAYIAAAWLLGEHKQFDFGIWLMFAIGTFAASISFTPLLALYQAYSPALVFVTLGLTAGIPPLCGFEPSTAHFMRRQLPRWQLKLPISMRIGTVIGYFWAALFLVAAGLCAYAPRDPRFTTLYPNLLVVVVGMTAGRWLPPLYLKLFPLALPTSVEPMIMGMPLAFDRRAAGTARASVQFCVSGAEPGNYRVRVGDGRCESFEGIAPAPDLVVHTPDTVWMRIVRGELDGARALAAGCQTIVVPIETAAFGDLDDGALVE